MKKSADIEQMLEINRIDFERSGKGQKAVHKFNIEFIEGKPIGITRNDLFAQGLVSVLTEDAITKELLLNNNYQFIFDTKFQLHIKNIEKQKKSLQEEVSIQERS